MRRLTRTVLVRSSLMSFRHCSLVATTRTTKKREKKMIEIIFEPLEQKLTRTQRKVRRAPLNIRRTID